MSLPEPGRRPPALIVIAVLLAVGGLYLYGIGTWPWDHDEVLSLAEIRIVSLDEFPGPRAQLDAMRRLLPVWVIVQGTALRLLPLNEFDARLVPTTCGIIFVVWAFGLAWRWRGMLFAWSLLAFLGGSQMLVWLSQQNRFYPIALLGLLATTALVLHRGPARADLIATAALAVICALTHTLTLVPLGLMAMTSLLGVVLGWNSRDTLVRSWAAFGAAALVYAFYSRPIILGWISGGTGGTVPIVSLFAQVGIAPLAFAILGVITAWSRTNRDGLARWWVTFAGLSLAFVVVVPLLLKNWNPRYALFFAAPLWVVAALGVEQLLASLPNWRLRVTLLLAVLALHAPKLASHLIDGSRHDFRTAAAVVARQRPALPVFSNWAATLQYYLEPQTGQRVRDWAGKAVIDECPCLVVIGTNLWQPVLQVPGARVDILAEVTKRRLDEQSHVVRVYRVERTAKF
jgi:hypothetical protein